MENQHDKIPVQTRLVEQGGFINWVWHQFLNQLFANYESRIKALETTIADHEARITALEP
ncbi:MAG: hypothetical protein Unbinned5081contig1003_7 [Prokaryotic dsDNA virus sp.]|nr:MAG: hypothetical protein Unbinned5081contig1003_7 [Prokaryotic dsDNA virus sp.]|tara:strand:- start:15772 stop:15951 length:180 start_codon:yes stop_codon:yes gene_type:complete